VVYCVADNECITEIYLIDRLVYCYKATRPLCHFICVICLGVCW